MTRFRISFIVMTVFALLLAACGDTAPSEAGASGAASQPAEESQAAESQAAEESEPPSSGAGRLATVQSRGNLICGVNGELPGFSFLDPEGQTVGFDADYCRAVAAAVFGDSEAVEFRNLTADQRGPALQTGEVDVLIRNTTWTVSRDTSWGLFAPTTFYDGQAIMVRADVGATTLEDLAGATICVQTGTTTELNLADATRDLEPAIEPITFADIDPTYQAYEEERCDAVTSDRSQLVARRTQFANPDDHIILDDVLSKEPLGPVAPLGDDGWFNVVKWVVFATIEAEELGIDSDQRRRHGGVERQPCRSALPGRDARGRRALRLRSRPRSRLGGRRDQPGRQLRGDLRPQPRAGHGVRPRARAQQPVE